MIFFQVLVLSRPAFFTSSTVAAPVVPVATSLYRSNSTFARGVPVSLSAFFTIWIWNVYTTAVSSIFSVVGVPGLLGLDPSSVAGRILLEYSSVAVFGLPVLVVSAVLSSSAL